MLVQLKKPNKTQKPNKTPQKPVGMGFKNGFFEPWFQTGNVWHSHCTRMSPAYLCEHTWLWHKHWPASASETITYQTYQYATLTDRDADSTMSPGCGQQPGMISRCLYAENTSLLHAHRQTINNTDFTESTNTSDCALFSHLFLLVRPTMHCVNRWGGVSASSPAYKLHNVYLNDP